MKKINELIIIATGGTGGHIFPALALAATLLENGYRVKVTADSKFAKYHPFDQTHLHIDAANFMGSSKLNIIFTLTKGFLKALWLLYKENPSVVIGFGGYATFPTMLAAAILGKTIILHEANTVIGKVNRLLLWRAKYLTTGFKKIIGVKSKYQEKIIYTGNPVRQEIIEAANNKKLGDKLTMLIIGGSQGAKVFSKIIPDVIMNLPESMKEKLYVIQQAKEEDIETIKEKYQRENITCEVKSFFDDINHKLVQANLVIARSGASTISELIVMKSPAIFIPLPSSADNHQYYNAKEISDLSAGWLVIEDSNVQKNMLNIIKSINRDHNVIEQYANNLSALQQQSSENILKVIQSL